MDSSAFVNSNFGRPGRSAGPAHLAYTVYLPKPIPRSVDLDPLTTAALSNADRALGRLAGSGRLLPNPMLLANLYVRREALSSTRIEGTQATLDDLYEAETGGLMGDDVREVVNYMTTLYQGLDAVVIEPITLDLVKRLHATLMTGVRGEDKQPGTVRTGPNWIGSADPTTARFVPPPHIELADGLLDWQSFVSENLLMPPLIKCALMHYQFETLHPFLDGNGRLGRLLIILDLVREEHLPQPLLYLSTYFEQHKSGYYDALQGVRETGDIQTWFQYFLTAIAHQANDAVGRSERLLDIAEGYRARLAGSRSRATEVVDLLLESPWITTGRTRDALEITNTGAANLLRQLAGVGVLTKLARVPGRSNRWVAHEMMSVLTDDS